jgi:hypothetical protein
MVKYFIDSQQGGSVNITKEIIRFNKHVEDARKIFEGIKGENNLAFIQGQNEFHMNYLSQLLLQNSKRLEILTFALIFLTFILAVLTIWNIILLINLY